MKLVLKSISCKFFFLTLTGLILYYFFLNKRKFFYLQYDKISRLSYIFIIPTLTYLSSIFCYAIIPIYADHVEPSIAVLSYLSVHNHEIYHALSNEMNYSILYGPYLFILPALSYFALGKSIYSIKIFYGTISFLSMAFYFLIIKFKFSSFKTAILMTGIVSFIYQTFYLNTFLNRGESLILFFLVIGMLSEIPKLHKYRFYFLFIASAFLINIKIHAFLYLTPFVLLHISSFSKLKQPNIIWPLLLSLFIVIIPFLLPNISFANFIDIMKNALSHDFSQSLFISNLSFYTIIAIIPFFTIVDFYNRTFPHFCKKIISLWYIFLPQLPILLIGSKDGAGVHHLYPLVIVNGHFLLILLKREDSKSPLPLILISSLVITYASPFKHSFKYCLNYLNRKTEAVERITEIKNILQKYQNASIHMGVATDKSYSNSFYKPLISFEDHPYCFDPVAMMDLHYHTENEVFANKIFDYCNIDIVLIPRENGNPEQVTFAISNWYRGPRSRLFSPLFTRNFLKLFTKIEKSAHFDIYQKNHR